MRRIVAPALAGLALLALAGCTGGQHGTSSSKIAPGSAGDSAGPAAGAPAPTTKPGSGSATPDLPTQALVRTADLTVRAHDVGGAADRAERVVAAAGGQIAGDQRGGSGRDAHADLVLQVPAGSLPHVLGELRGLGQQTSLRTSTRDVTQQVADVNSRVASMRDAIARLRTLYGRAGSIKDVLAVESTLSQREADLESLEAQQRALAQRTSMATIDLHLLTPAAPPKTGHQPGFVAGVIHGWQAFAVAVRWLLAALGAALPFLAAAGAVLAGVLLIRRRRPRRPASAD